MQRAFEGTRSLRRGDQCVFLAFDAAKADGVSMNPADLPDTLILESQPIIVAIDEYFEHFQSPYVSKVELG